MDYHDKMDLEDEDQEEQGDNRGELQQLPSINKKRRVQADDAFDESSTRLVSFMDLSKGKRKMESMYTIPGTQMSVFNAAQRRLLGFRATSTQGLCAERPSQETLVGKRIG